VTVVVDSGGRHWYLDFRRSGSVDRRWRCAARREPSAWCDGLRSASADHSAAVRAAQPAVALAELDEPGAAETITVAFVERARLVDPNTINRELSVMKAAVAWWRGRGWLTTSPIAGIEHRPAPPDRTRALSRGQIADLFALKVPLREKALWRMLYETCARAEEILTLDVNDLLPDDKRGKVISKGGAPDWVHWQSSTAQLLPRPIKGRTHGPVFLTDRKAPAHTPTKDRCKDTGQARLSYRRAAELFELHPPGQPRHHRPRRTRGTRRMDPAPAPPLRPHPRSRRRHQHPHPARPLPPRLRPLPRTLRPAQRRPSPTTSPTATRPPAAGADAREFT
jgi:integrase